MTKLVERRDSQALRKRRTKKSWIAHHSGARPDGTSTDEESAVLVDHSIFA